MNETNKFSHLPSGVQIVPETKILQQSSQNFTNAKLGDFKQIVRIHSKNEQARRAKLGGNYP